jgi:hypothetical protein
VLSWNFNNVSSKTLSTLLKSSALARKLEPIFPLYCCQASKYFVLNVNLLWFSRKLLDILVRFWKYWGFLDRYFYESPQYQKSKKAVQWEPGWYTWTDRRTDRYDEANKHSLRIIRKHLIIAWSFLSHVPYLLQADKEKQTIGQ